MSQANACFPILSLNIARLRSWSVGVTLPLALLICVGLQAGCQQHTAGHAINPVRINADPADSDTDHDQALPGTVLLERGPIQARIWLGGSHADEPRYRGVRFETAGTIAEVITPNHTYFGNWKSGQPGGSGHDDLQGLADEFDLHRALGYEEAAPGETFVKVGVGVLRRPDKRPYIFHRDYELVEPVQWRMQREPAALTLSHTLTHQSWGYHYRKIIALHEDGLSISRTLTNVGGRTIQLDHYGHNFVRIDDRAPIDDGYRLKFSAPVALHDPNPAALTFTRPTPTGLAFSKGLKESLQTRVVAAEANDAFLPVRVGHARTGGWVEIDLDPTLARLVLWASPSVVCPETFVVLHVPPGDTQRWTTRYRFAL